MVDEDQFPPQGDHAAKSIVQCLRMLAEEAAGLRLSRTLAALQAAIDTCVAENGHAMHADAHSHIPDEISPTLH
jgi:hypothetical protein